MDLSVETRDEGGRSVVAVAGEVDVYTGPRLRERLNDLLDSGENHLIIDLTAVDFLDSTGLGILVGVLSRVKSVGGSMVLVCSAERILKVFRITGLHALFPIAPDLDSALGTQPVATVRMPRHRANTFADPT